MHVVSLHTRREKLHIFDLKRKTRKRENDIGLVNGMVLVGNDEN